MCIFNSRRAPAPTPPPVITTPKAPPTAVAPEAIAARGVQKKKLATQHGRKQTILTGSRGVQSSANTYKKTLLGQ